MISWRGRLQSMHAISIYLSEILRSKMVLELASDLHLGYGLGIQNLFKYLKVLFHLDDPTVLH